MSQEEWGRVLRTAPNLRVLTLPTLVVTDGTDAFKHGQDDYCVDEDMLIDTASISSMTHSSSNLDSLSTISYLPATSTQDRLPVWLQPLYLQLSIFAEDFADLHLHSPIFKELRFIHDVLRPNNYYRECRVIRFSQELDQDAPGERYMMKFLGVMQEGPAEDDALFWIPRLLRRSQ